MNTNKYFQSRNISTAKFENAISNIAKQRHKATVRHILHYFIIWTAVACYFQIGRKTHGSVGDIFLSLPIEITDPIVFLPIKNPSLLEHVAKVDVSVQEIWIQSHGLLEVMDRQPDLALSVEHAAKIAPRDREIWTRFNRL